MKIYITGGSGTGKTTYAKYLAKKHNITYLGLDSVKWRLDTDKAFTKCHPREERVKILKKFLADTPDWICDGTYYQDWVNDIIHSADIVIIIDTPTLVRHIRCIRRAFLHQNRDTLSLVALWKLLIWSHNYRRKDLPGLCAKLDAFGKKYIIIKSKHLTEML
ncbi:MAG: hypothetical protein IKL37_03435 [Alphaproteobacteria bacterium]|nr:hypothetical protein [Alphaproteobacteria bacterium]